jgi:hypothetical protein
MAICDIKNTVGNSIGSSFGENKTQNVLPKGRANIHLISDPALRKIVSTLDENLLATARSLGRLSNVYSPIAPFVKQMIQNIPEISSKSDTIIKIIRKEERGELGNNNNHANCVVMCRVLSGETTSNGFGKYKVALYENGPDSNKTGEGYLYIAELALGSTIPKDSWILGHKHFIQEVGGNE